MLRQLLGRTVAGGELEIACLGAVDVAVAMCERYGAMTTARLAEAGTGRQPAAGLASAHQMHQSWCVDVCQASAQLAALVAAACAPAGPRKGANQGKDKDIVRCMADRMSYLMQAHAPSTPTQGSTLLELDLLMLLPPGCLLEAVSA